MQALMLAAGMGKRLGKYTNNNTKCMVEVAGEKLIDRAIKAVKSAGISKFIIVIGYEGEALRRHVMDKFGEQSIDFVFINNPDYRVSNNIYSFYLAKDCLVQDDTILLESDLIYDEKIIKKMVDCDDENVVAVARYESWMDGTVVVCDDKNNITQFVEKVDMDLKLLDIYCKTVNIYKFSREFSKNVYLPFLEAYMQAYGNNSYYETVLKVVSHLARTRLKALFIDEFDWYEIDDAQDLDIANVMFSKGKSKYNLITSKFGGYWRYKKMLDFCYLVNPYFPPAKMVEKMQNEFSVLLTQYPSGLSMQNMNAERFFGIDQENILVGNGAAELINVLGMYAKGKVAVCLPTFNEYVRCFKNCELVKIDNSKNNYYYDIDELKEILKSVNMLCIVSPDNPSGALLKKKEVLELLEIAKENNAKVIIDESFIDFADSENRYTLLDDNLLVKYPNLGVVKSISKSYGVPALRLGVFATSDTEMVKFMRANMQVWNINSFAEYFLQTFSLFSNFYFDSCDKIAEERNRFIAELVKIKSIDVYPSQANYILINLKEKSSIDFCVKMLDNYNILIKDLSTKDYFYDKNFIRVAIRNTKDNNIIIAAIKELLL